MKTLENFEKFQIDQESLRKVKGGTSYYFALFPDGWHLCSIDNNGNAVDHGLVHIF